MGQCLRPGKKHIIPLLSISRRRPMLTRSLPPVNENTIFSARAGVFPHPSVWSRYRVSVHALASSWSRKTSGIPATPSILFQSAIAPIVSPHPIHHESHPHPLDHRQERLRTDRCADCPAMRFICTRADCFEASFCLRRGERLRLTRELSQGHALACLTYQC